MLTSNRFFSRRASGHQPPFDQLPWKDEGANDNA